MSNAKVILLHPDDYVDWLTQLVPAAFMVDRLGLDPDGRYSYPQCRVRACSRASKNLESGLCRTHDPEWGDRTEPLNQLVERLSAMPQGPRRCILRSGGFNMADVSHPVVRVELAFGLYQRGKRANGCGPTRPEAFNKLVQVLNNSGVTTLLDLSESQRRDIGEACGSHAGSARPVLEQTIRSIREARGDNDVRRAIGTRRGGSTRYSRHQEITQPWLRELVARWVDFKRNTEAGSPQHIGQQEACVVVFAEWCDGRVNSPADFTRPLLVEWLGHVRRMNNPSTGEVLSASYSSKYVSAVENFVDVVRVEFDQPVPPNARYLKGERPKRAVSVPRFLEPQIIDLLRRPESLQLIQDPSHRLAVTIMIKVGLRAGHTCGLPFDCLLDLNRNGSDDKWGLAFVDTKTGSNMLLPIEPDVAAGIREAQRYRRTQTDEDNPRLLFHNPRSYKTQQLNPEALNRVLTVWARQLNLRETDGSRVNVTPHRFRHTFATEMLEKGVPIDVVKVLLGHKNIANTEIYAAVTDRRLREEWEKARVVDVRGELVGLPDGPEGDVEWLLHRIGRAVQPLANGWCGLPIQQSCPHANACLDDCDHFMTSVEFLPALIEQRDSHARFVSQAEKAGHLRIAEINRRPMDNLDRIIKTVKGEGSHGAHA